VAEQIVQALAGLERPGRAANILASVEEQCRWLRDIGFQDVDCFWKYFELGNLRRFPLDKILWG